jgi:hypothetical protein
VLAVGVAVAAVAAGVGLGTAVLVVVVTFGATGLMFGAVSLALRLFR